MGEVLRKRLGDLNRHHALRGGAEHEQFDSNFTAGRVEAHLHPESMASKHYPRRSGIAPTAVVMNAFHDNEEFPFMLQDSRL